LIEKGTVEASQHRCCPFVRPGVEPVKKRELEEGKRSNRIVKGRGKIEVKVGIILVRRIPNKIEIADNEPRQGEERAKNLELGKKKRREGVIRRRVDVGNCKDEVAEGG
jgi:hypothetical protein